MPRLIPAIAALGALVMAVPSAAQIGSGKIAYVTVGLHTMNPDGSGKTLIRQGIPYELANPRWSPDGSQVAFTAYETIDRQRVVVMNADGSNEHNAATGRLELGPQPWSPDGARIAYVKDKEIYTAAAAGGDERRLTLSDRFSSAPAWSPTGASLAYSSRVGTSPERWELFVVGADGSGPAQITSSAPGWVENISPAWSPSGDAIAFQQIVVGEDGIYFVRPDGTGLRRLAPLPLYTSAQQLAWSPDGTRVAFASVENTGYAPQGGGLVQEIFVVNTDGSGKKRLTELSSKNLSGDGAPLWSPDGARILFARNGWPATMNPDGTCEDVIEGQITRGMSWQAVPGGGALPLKSCRAIAVGGNVEVSADQAHASFLAQVINDGTEPLIDVELEVRADPSADLSAEARSGCSSQPYVLCRFARIEAGQTVQIPLHVSTRFLYLQGAQGAGTSLRVRLQGTADGLRLTGAESLDARFTTHSCSPDDPGRGWIGGSNYGDLICGRRGPDRIYPRGGKDVVRAGGGADSVFSADRKRDRISCGRERDRVVADRRDVVARDCERVRRI